MDISVKINILLSIGSFLISFVSIIFLIVTIRQNHAILENESRAYLSIYTDITDCHTVALYLILKNYGKSSARITRWECDTDLAPFSRLEGFVPFSHMKNTSIAPNQSYKYALSLVNLKISEIQKINFNVTYRSNKRKYSESICIDLPPLWDEIHTNAPPEADAIKVISDTLQDINRRML